MWKEKKEQDGEYEIRKAEEQWKAGFYSEQFESW